MGLDINIEAVAKNKVTSMEELERLDYTEKIKIFYARKNEFVKKELQNAIRGTITEDNDYLGMNEYCIIDAGAIERLEARIAEFEKDIPAALERIEQDYDLSSFHAAVVAFSELVVCASQLVRAVDRERHHLTFSWIS